MRLALRFRFAGPIASSSGPKFYRLLFLEVLPCVHLVFSRGLVEC